MVDQNTHTLDQTLAALADPTRRAILQAVQASEQTVTALADPFDMSLNAVSKHIKILERAGLVRRRQAGRAHFISAVSDPVDEAWAWLESYRRFWAARLDQLEAVLAADKHQEDNQDE